MTETRTLPDDLEALDWDVPCETCDSPAEFIGILHCCNANGFACLRCHIRALIHIKYLFDSGTVQCKTCEKYLAPEDIEWRTL